MDDTATEAPGEAPSSAAKFLFFVNIISVPNSSLGPLMGQFLII